MSLAEGQELRVTYDKVMYQDKNLGGAVQNAKVLAYLPNIAHEVVSTGESRLLPSTAPSAGVSRPLNPTASSSAGVSRPLNPDATLVVSDQLVDIESLDIDSIRPMWDPYHLRWRFVWELTTVPSQDQDPSPIETPIADSRRVQLRAYVTVAPRQRVRSSGPPRCVIHVCPGLNKYSVLGFSYSPKRDTFWINKGAFPTVCAPTFIVVTNDEGTIVNLYAATPGALPSKPVPVYLQTFIS